MNVFTENLEYYINQYELEKQIFLMGKEIKKRGWLEKSEFLTICLWKSRRPKRLYDLNSEKEIVSKSKLSFNEKDEL